MRIGILVLRWTLSIAAGAVFCATELRAQSNCAQSLQPTRRTIIYNSFILKNLFTTDRTLSNYSLHFPFRTGKSLVDLVRDLFRNAIWVDMGAGTGAALFEGLSINPEIEGVGVSYKRPETLYKDPDPEPFKYIEGDYVENLAKDGKLDHLKNRVALLTDIVSPLSYSRDLVELLQIYMDLLMKDGTLVFNIMTERNFEMRDGKKVALDQILKVNRFKGSNTFNGLAEWLREISGIEVEEIVDVTANLNGFYEKSIGYKIRKTAENVTIPKTLRTIRYKSGAPPVRVFQLLRSRR